MNSMIQYSKQSENEDSLHKLAAKSTLTDHDVTVYQKFFGSGILQIFG